MKKTNTLIALAFFAGLCARAQETPGPDTMTSTQAHSSMNRSMDDMTGKFGAGLVFGQPTGPTVKYWLNDTLAIDSTLGWSLRDDDNQPSRGSAAVYCGVGPSIEFRDEEDSRSWFASDGPVGIQGQAGWQVVCWI